MPLLSKQLTLLVEVRRTGSLARAALNLSVTPPAVSQQLARMEKEIGASLVVRGARGAQLTTLGSLLADHGEVVISELGRAEEAAAELIGARARRLRVGAFPSASVALFPEALAALRHRFPDAELSLVDLASDAGPALVAAGELDLALTATYGRTVPPEGVHLVHVRSDPLHLVVPDDHHLAHGDANEPVLLGSLAEETWVSGIVGRPSRSQLHDAAAEAGFVPRVPFQTESYDVAQAMVAAGVAIALVPELALRPGVPTVNRRLVPDLTREISAVLPGNEDDMGLAGELLDVVRQVCDVLP